MYHCLPRNWLLATNKIEVEFRNGFKEQSKKGFGSGFWINAKAGLVFATNRHVVDLEYSDEKYVGMGYQLSSVEILTFDANGNRGRQIVKNADIYTYEDYGIDIALLKIASVENPKNIKVTPAELEIIGDDEFQSDQLEWGAQISFTSFQPWRDTKSERPILRTGILSSDPKYPFESEACKLKDVHLLEAFSFDGSSGSPVIANARGVNTGAGLSGGNFRPAKIIGIMTGHLLSNETEPYKVHTGLSFCHRSVFLLKMVREWEHDCNVNAPGYLKRSKFCFQLENF